MQRATTSHNDPELRHKMNETHKKLNSLAYALSPLNPLTARILMKIILMLVPRVRSAPCCLPTSGTHPTFRHCFCCKHLEAFCARNITDLAVKRLKSKYKYAEKSFLCVYFFLFFT